MKKNFTILLVLFSSMLVFAQKQKEDMTIFLNFDTKFTLEAMPQTKPMLVKFYFKGDKVKVVSEVEGFVENSFYDGSRWKKVATIEGKNFLIADADEIMRADEPVEENIEMIEKTKLTRNSAKILGYDCDEYSSFFRQDDIETQRTVLTTSNEHFTAAQKAMLAKFFNLNLRLDEALSIDGMVLSMKVSNKLFESTLNVTEIDRNTIGEDSFNFPSDIAKTLTMEEFEAEFFKQ
jgi:hypothetical protein